MALLLALGTLLLYLQVRHADFLIFDDDDYVTENRMVQAGLTPDGIGWAFGFHASNWHPATWISHMLDCELFGLNPGAHHLVNALFHAVNAALLFALLWRLTKRLWPALIVAALFAWHPLRVESVAWVAERKDVLSVFFGLLTLLAYGRYTAESKVQSPRSKVFYALSLVFFALALMSKPMMVTLPFVMLLLDLWPLNRFTIYDLRFTSGPLMRVLLEKLPFFLLTLGSCVLTYLAQRGESVVSFEHVPLGLRLENALMAYAGYLAKTFYPVHLAVIYPLRSAIPWSEVAAAGIVLLSITAAVWWTRKNHAYLFVGWLWFLGTLVPVIGLVQVGGQAMADRYTYLPQIGLLIAVVFGVAELAARWRLQTLPLGLAAAIVLAGCVWGTTAQLAYWHDSVALFQHAIAVARDSSIARINLGVALERVGRPADALAQYERALVLSPGRAQVHNNLGTLLDQMGRTNEAQAHYREALRLKPDAPVTHLNFGTLLVKLGRMDEGIKEYSEAARLLPGDPRPWYLSGKAELKRGNDPAAVADFREALRRDGNDFQALTFLARTLASSNDSQVRNGVEALAAATRANELTGGSQPFVLDALAMAQAESGRFAEATETIQRAIDLFVAAGETNTVPELRERLVLYQSGKPRRGAIKGGD